MGSPRSARPTDSGTAPKRRAPNLPSWLRRRATVARRASLRLSGLPFLSIALFAACDASPAETYNDVIAPQILGVPAEIVTTSSTMTIQGEVRDDRRVEEVGVGVAFDPEIVVPIGSAARGFAIEIDVDVGVTMARLWATDNAGNTAARWIRIERQRTGPEPIGYELVQLGSLGGDVTIPADVNNQRQVVGRGTMANGSWRAFLWEAGAMTVLDTVPHEGRPYWTVTLGSRATAINDSGVIVGGHEFLGLVWEGGVPRDLGLATGYRAVWPTDVNGSGVIAGGWRDVAPGAQQPSGGFIIDGTGVVTVDSTYSRATTNVTALDNQGRAIGVSACRGGGSCTYVTPFIYRDGVRIPLEDELGTARPRAISSAGQVVGSHLATVEPYIYPLAFLWQDGEVITLGALHRLWTSEGAAINDAGEIVGVTFNPSRREDEREAFIWRDGYMRSLAHAAGGEWKIVEATAINDNGEITAVARRAPDAELEAVLLIPVP